MLSRANQSWHSWNARLEKALDELCLEVPEVSRNKLIEFLVELEKWNRTYNLTAIRSIDEMLVQHVFDCLAIVPAVDAYERHHQLGFEFIADIGSGAGLPAVVLSVVRPQTRIVSIDAVEKKTSFVQFIANKLDLDNLQSLHKRVEDISDNKFDLVISRAFASLSKFVQLSGSLLDDNGVIAAMKANQVETEAQELLQNHSDWYVHQVDEIVVPEMQAKRCLAWLQRKKHD